MLSALLQVTDSARALETATAGGDGEFSFWAGIASIVGLVLTIVGLGLTGWSLRKALKAQDGAERAQERAETLRSQYARKQRLPEFRDSLDGLATRLDTALNEFVTSQPVAVETTTQISRTIRSLRVHLRGDSLSEVAGIAEEIGRHASVITLHSGQTVRNCTRDVVLLLTHVIDDERARSL